MPCAHKKGQGTRSRASALCLPLASGQAPACEACGFAVLCHEGKAISLSCPMAPMASMAGLQSPCSQDREARSLSLTVSRTSRLPLLVACTLRQHAAQRNVSQSVPESLCPSLHAGSSRSSLETRCRAPSQSRCCPQDSLAWSWRVCLSAFSGIPLAILLKVLSLTGHGKRRRGGRGYDCLTA